MSAIQLKPFDRSCDWEQLIRWASNPDLLFNWMGASFQYPLTREQIERYQAEAWEENPTLFIFQAIDENGAPVGHIEVGRVNRTNDYARLERVLVGESARRGTGVGTAMVRQAAEFAFRELQLHRLELLVFEDNHAAIRCYEKAGFITEGVMREARKAPDGSYRDLRMMAMLVNSDR